uniref:RING-type domain-containing protein n=1 Tax=Quercus lobata TaxID=97700 RepID=A0A7N2RBE8_QUELO
MEGGERNSDRRRRLTLWDQMSAVEGAVNRESSSGSTLCDILCTTDKQPSSAAAAATAAEPQPQVRHSNRTLLDVIREQDPNAARSAYKGLNINTNNSRDKKSWKTFKDKLRLKRAGAAWTSSVPIPASDIPIQQQGSLSRRNSVRFRSSAELTQSSEDLSRPPPPQILRRNSTRYSPGDLIPAESTQFPVSESTSFVPQTTRHNATRFVGTPHHRNTEISSSSSSSSSDDDEEEGDSEIAPHTPTRRLSVVLAEERALSAREAVAAQEAAERERQEQLNTLSTTAEPPVRMSLMDLMDYNMDDDEEEEEEEEGEENERNEGKGKEEEAEEENGSGSKRGEYKCCVCMVRHKGSAFIPCGHTFCRLCSRELMVSRGTILENFVNNRNNKKDG